MSFRLDNTTSLFVFLLSRVRVSCTKNRSPSCRISLCISVYPRFPLVFILSQPCRSLIPNRCRVMILGAKAGATTTRLRFLPRATSTFARCHVKSSLDAKDACTCCVSACFRVFPNERGTGMRRLLNRLTKET